MLGPVSSSPVEDKQGCALQQAQLKTTKMNKGLVYLSEERLGELELFSLDQGSLSGVLSMFVNI